MKKLVFIQTILLLYCQNIFTSIEDYFPYSVEPSPSNYGTTGIMEIPNARFIEAASLRFSFSASYPNEFTSVTATPFEWFEATYRYAEVKNKKYGPSAYSGNQSWKDKGFDIKFRLSKEGFLMPAMAIGLRDIAGTGAFASEYIVATKDLGNLDFTLGLGWGLLGSEASLSNPLSFLGDNLRQRDGSSDLGGDFIYKNWFSGRASILAGIEYDFNKYGLKFKLEYDTSNPDLNNFNPIKVESRFNLGLNYFLSESLVLGVGFERGEQFRVSFALAGNFFEDTVPKPPPKNVIKLSKLQLQRTQEDKGIFYRSLNKSLRDEGIFIQGASYDRNAVEAVVATTRLGTISRIVGRSARIVSALTPNTVEEITIGVMNGDLEVAKVTLNRMELDQANLASGSSNEVLGKSELSSSSSKPTYLSTDFKPIIKFPEFTWNMTPALRHQIGGPEGFYLGQLWWKTSTAVKFARHFSLYTNFGIDIYNTFNNFVNTSQSSIPHVRSDIQNYLDEGKNNIERMQLEYMYSPFRDVFFRADFGLLEEMFGGFGGEIYYRPFNKNYSFGFSLHKVKQRGYDQKFKFRKYSTETGHLGIYYDFFEGISGQLLIGKYLAGDKGATLDVSRRFKTGFTLGVFATKTDLSKEEFGEGSFDKGFYFSIPLKLFYTDYRTGGLSFGVHPLTKDGGALLSQHNSLFSILGDSNRNAILRDWKDLLD